MEILMISYWDFQEHGMQVIKKTPLYFAEHGHHIKFLVHSEQTANPSKIIDLHPNIEVYRFDLPFKFLSNIPKINRIRQFILFAIYCLIYTQKIYKRGSKPDIIYAGECDAILIGSILQRIYGAPLIARYYGLSRVVSCIKDENYLREAGGKWHQHLLTKLALKCNAAMVVCTDDGSQSIQILKHFNKKLDNVKLWRNGIEEAKTDPDQIDLLRQTYKGTANNHIILTVSRLSPDKRVDRAIRLMHYLFKSNKKNIKLIIVGDGSEREKLDLLAHKLDVSQFVVFAGAVAHENVYNFYHIADVFLSLYDTSNIGNPLLEALNSGKCIVTLNTGETKKVIRNNDNGIIIDREKDEEKLAKKLASVIKRLLDDATYRRKFEQSSKECAKEHLWTWNKRLQMELKSILELENNSQE